MTEAYICDYIRTPIGRYGGALAHVRADDLAAIPIKALMDRTVVPEGTLVRSLDGALLPVGDGRKPASWPGSLLARRERANEVVVAPALGLTLVAVGYPSDPGELAVRAVERIEPGEDRLKYDHLFAPGDPENKSFWSRVAGEHDELANRFVLVA